MKNAPPRTFPRVVVVEAAHCNLIWPANSPVMSLSVLDSSGGEVARGHYLSTLPFDGSRVLEKKQLKANHTNGSGSSACRGTELLGKLQSPW